MDDGEDDGGTEIEDALDEACELIHRLFRIPARFRAQSLVERVSGLRQIGGGLSELAQLPDSLPFLKRSRAGKL